MTRTPRRARRSYPATRDGITFYEVFLALVLLVGALAVLGQHVSLGVRSADQARLRTKAEELATTKLNEVLAGIEPLETSAGVPLTDDDGLWSYSVEVAAGPADGLLNLTVVITHEGLRGSPDEAFRLQQFIRDPAVLLDAQVSESAGGTSL
ncbi:hypothetical protein [Alienimonas chondri]|uniref:Type II secretion system protein n=1 Tax=Alienimonas chondri TaxID=2681879 RepID=A0ABX1VCV0_9PLAN|nr:hypothetical protein [Alienimonas chondri]NNJ25717.1 hypothetical protein [Alienimonas chondri]